MPTRNEIVESPKASIRRREQMILAAADADMYSLGHRIRSTRLRTPAVFANFLAYISTPHPPEPPTAVIPTYVFRMMQALAAIGYAQTLRAAEAEEAAADGEVRDN